MKPWVAAAYNKACPECFIARPFNDPCAEANVDLKKLTTINFFKINWRAP